MFTAADILPARPASTCPLISSALMEPKNARHCYRRMDQQLRYLATVAPAEQTTSTGGGLVYLSNLEGGIARKPGKNSFRYYKSDGTRITDPDELARFAALAIPPAYADVLISPDPNSHLQAVGTDTRGRKQYRYHPEWSAERDRAKFDQLGAFGSSAVKVGLKLHLQQ